MTNLGKLFTTVGAIALFSAIPLRAQVIYGVTFTAPFAFYVGNTQMPNGTYTLTQPEGLNNAIAIVTSANGRLSASIGVRPTLSLQPPRQSKIIFEKYGDSFYFDRVLLSGDPHGIASEATKAEKRAEETARVAEERSVGAAGQ